MYRYLMRKQAAEMPVDDPITWWGKRLSPTVEKVRKSLPSREAVDAFTESLRKQHEEGLDRLGAPFVKWFLKNRPNATVDSIKRNQRQRQVQRAINAGNPTTSVRYSDKELGGPTVAEVQRRRNATRVARAVKDNTQRTSLMGQLSPTLAAMYGGAPIIDAVGASLVKDIPHRDLIENKLFLDLMSAAKNKERSYFKNRDEVRGDEGAPIENKGYDEAFELDNPGADIEQYGYGDPETVHGATADLARAVAGGDRTEDKEPVKTVSNTNIKNLEKVREEQQKQQEQQEQRKGQNSNTAKTTVSQPPVKQQKASPSGEQPDIPPSAPPDGANPNSLDNLALRRERDKENIIKETEENHPEQTGSQKKSYIEQLGDWASKNRRSLYYGGGGALGGGVLGALLAGKGNRLLGGGIGAATGLGGGLLAKYLMDKYSKNNA